MKKLAVALCLLLLTPVPAFAGPLDALVGVSGVSICNGISAYELWNSTAQSARSGEAVVLLYVLDPEAAPDGAILLIGQTGTGDEPVCLRVASPSEQTVRVLAGPSMETFIVEGGSRAFRLTIDEGARVLLDQAVIGQIR